MWNKYRECLRWCIHSSPWCMRYFCSYTPTLSRKCYPVKYIFHVTAYGTLSQARYVFRGNTHILRLNVLNRWQVRFDAASAYFLNSRGSPLSFHGSDWLFARRLFGSKTLIGNFWYNCYSWKRAWKTFGSETGKKKGKKIERRRKKG